MPRTGATSKNGSHRLKDALRTSNSVSNLRPAIAAREISSCRCPHERRVESGFAAIDAKFDAVDAKFEAMDAKFGAR